MAPNMASQQLHSGRPILLCFHIYLYYYYATQFLLQDNASSTRTFFGHYGIGTLLPAHIQSSFVVLDIVNWKSEQEYSAAAFCNIFCIHLVFCCFHYCLPAKVKIKVFMMNIFLNNNMICKKIYQHR